MSRIIIDLVKRTVQVENQGQVHTATLIDGKLLQKAEQLLREINNDPWMGFAPDDSDLDRKEEKK